MLTKKTEVKPSKYGLGLFAAEFIQKGDVIWIFDPQLDRIIDSHTFNQLDSITKDFLNTYAYTDEHDRLIICCDAGKYINHSKNNNVLDFIHPIWGSISTAKRDIMKNEELLCDYESFDKSYPEYKHLLL